MPLVFASYCHCLKSTDLKSILILKTGVFPFCVNLFKTSPETTLAGGLLEMCVM